MRISPYIYRLFSLIIFPVLISCSVIKEENNLVNSESLLFSGKAVKIYLLNDTVFRCGVNEIKIITKSHSLENFNFLFTAMNFEKGTNIGEYRLTSDCDSEICHIMIYLKGNGEIKMVDKFSLFLLPGRDYFDIVPPAGRDL